MKVVFINSRCTNSIFLEGDYVDLDDAFDRYIKEEEISNDTFVHAYWDWEVYIKKGSRSYLQYQGTVVELFNTPF